MRFKGQAAMEYLMTYGWAIIIIIVAVAALYAMGVFNVGGTTVTCSPCFSYFAYVDYSGGTLLMRNGPQEITITSIEGATNTSATYDPGADISLTSITTPVQINITYDVVDGLTGHTDTATIRG